MISFSTLILIATAACNAEAKGALYFQTNDPAGNHIIVHSIADDNGEVSFVSAEYAGGLGAAHTLGHPDGLFSQGSVAVGENVLYSVNSGSNSIATFKIEPSNPTTISFLSTVPSGGDFPISLAYSADKQLLCVLNGGTNNGVQCFDASVPQLVNIPATWKSLGVPQTTPASGPAGSLSDIAFSPDSSLLYVSVKGNPATGAAGFIATYKVSGSGAAATLGTAIKTEPAGSVLPFSLTPVPNSRTVVYTDPASGYGVASFNADGSLGDSAHYAIPGQGANCWSEYSATTGNYYLSDPGAKYINEVSVSGVTSTLVKQYPAFGPLELAVAGKYLYVLSPGLTGIEVFSIGAAGKAVSVQQYMTSTYIPLTNMIQGLAIYRTVVGAAYSQTNDPAGNSVLIHSIFQDGTVAFAAAVPTGGNGGASGAAGRPDGLFSQDSVIVGGNFVYVVNSGSNTVSAFAIDEHSPAKLALANTVPSGGDFPISLAYSKARNLVVVLNGGTNNGVQGFSVSKAGLLPIPASWRPLGLPQTTPASGPAGSLSDIAFSPDSSLLYVSVKGNPATGAAGFIATYKVSGSGAAATLGTAIKTEPAGSVLPFSLTPVPNSRTVVYTDPASGYGVASFNADGSLGDSAHYAIPGQGANCWSEYSATTGNYYLSDPGAKYINEVSVSGVTSTLVKQYPAFGPLDLAISGNYIYVLSPKLTGIEVFWAPTAGEAVSVQQYHTSWLTTLTPSLQGIALFFTPPSNFKHFVRTIGATYSQTNDPAGNRIIVHSIASDGTVAFAAAIPTGGNGGASGAAGRPDGLFSQDSVVVGGGFVFAVNSGSNTVSAFAIDPKNPARITAAGSVASGGDFPISLAYSADKHLLFVLNGGEKNGVQGFSVSSTGLHPIHTSWRPLGVPQTTPASGPAGSLSDIAFSPDSSLLYVSVKGNPATGAAGFIATYKVSGSGAAATLGTAIKTEPAGSVLPFSLTPVPNSRTVVYTDPASGYGVASFNADGSLGDSAHYAIPGQGANCWSEYSATTGNYYLSDPGAKYINEVSVSGVTSTLVKQYPAFGPLELAVAGKYLYVLSPGLTGIEVFSIGAAGKAVSVQQYRTSSLIPLTPSLQGIAVYLVQ